MAVTLTRTTRIDMVTLDATAGNVTLITLPSSTTTLVIDPRGADLRLYLAGTDGAAGSGDYDIIYSGSKEVIRLASTDEIYLACPTVNSQVIGLRVERVD